ATHHGPSPLLSRTAARVPPQQYARPAAAGTQPPHRTISGSAKRKGHTGESTSRGQEQPPDGVAQRDRRRYPRRRLHPEYRRPRTNFGEMACSIARTLDVIGEPWSPLVLRDVWAGVDRFDQLQADLGISRKVLT